MNIKILPTVLCFVCREFRVSSSLDGFGKFCEKISKMWCRLRRLGKTKRGKARRYGLVEDILRKREGWSNLERLEITYVYRASRRRLSPL